VVLGLVAIVTILGLAMGAGGAAIMLARARRGGLPVDLPDDRRLHQTPTPRGGGIGIPLAGLAAIPFALGAADARATSLVVLGWALPNGLLGLVDDYRPMRSRVKFAIQLAVALAVAALGLRIDVLAVPPFPPLALGWAGIPFTALWLVWMANVFNFMDGMDALAAGSGVVFFVALAILATATGLGAVAAGLAGGLAGFLVYNAPPAKMFMGDAGSLFVGAALGGLAVALAPAVPFCASVLLLGTFVWDATYTIVRRLFRGDPMLPHRTHLFQRLALAGWSHGRVRAVYFSLALAAAGGALAYPVLPSGAQAALLGAALAAGVGLVAITRRLERLRA
jgi:UDP-N-acetylmuramyl pentapeptide phosphotransferase/UDP-N-acetylglucosamine-1-phosphate transferase